MPLALPVFRAANNEESYSVAWNPEHYLFCDRRSSVAVASLKQEPNVLSHQVYFTLKDPSESACKELIASCRKYLPHHDGVAFFAAGTHTPDLNRPVNDSAFHVTINVVFETREAHDIYQTSENHLAFIAENKDGWKQVRVFDADVS